ncbi:MAG: potassium transporter TrkG, partial [Synechococcus sp.]
CNGAEQGRPILAIAVRVTRLAGARDLDLPVRCAGQAQRNDLGIKGGTGGGIKTTTVAALMAATRSTLRGREVVVIRNRSISDKVVLRAVGITVGSLLFVMAMAMLISIASNLNGKDSFTFMEMLFTCISAFATVGLDLGVTVELPRFGQAVLMVGMFVGRLGILLLLSAIWEAMTQEQIQMNRQNRVGYPSEDLYV